jgi:hypothetical protein
MTAHGHSAVLEPRVLPLARATGRREHSYCGGDMHGGGGGGRHCSALQYRLITGRSRGPLRLLGAFLETVTCSEEVRVPPNSM